LLALLVGGCGEPAPTPRNLLLVTVDTLRADHLSSHGYERKTSPGLDRLAADGFRFRNAIVQRGGTWPSLTSILTSMYPRSHGVRSNGDVLDGSKRTIAELLRERGFRTVAFLTNMLTAEHRGFDEVALFGDNAKGGRDAAAAANAVLWLRDHRDVKFFLWLHLMGPHDPYEPTPKYRGSFDTGYVGPVDGSRKLLKTIHASKHRLSERELAHIVSLYDAEILQVDARIRTVLDTLDDLDIASDTLVVFSSDHGEELYGQNSYFFHSFSIYESVLHVPLIFSLPGRLPLGMTVDTIVESIDLAPTMFELLGLAIPDDFEGTTLVPLISGDGDASARPNVAYSELGPYIQSIRTDRWHYIYNPRQLSSPGSGRKDTGRRGGLFDREGGALRHPGGSRTETQRRARSSGRSRRASRSRPQMARLRRGTVPRARSLPEGPRGAPGARLHRLTVPLARSQGSGSGVVRHRALEAVDGLEVLVDQLRHHGTNRPQLVHPAHDLADGVERDRLRGLGVLVGSHDHVDRHQALERHG
jgi:arylsulfatase A-like enzyme